MHTAVCLCVPFCSGREFGISQHRLGNAVETTAVFFKTMITSCPASATSQNFTFSHSVRELCRCIYVFVCAPLWMACMHICVPSQWIRKNTPCVAFSSMYRASPLSHVIMENPTASYTSDKTQSPIWIVQHLRNSAEDGKYTHTSKPALRRSQSHSPNTRPTGFISLDCHCIYIFIF